jgi:hypothetical protein
MNTSEFLATLRDEVLEPDEYIDMQQIEQELRQYEDAIHCLEQFGRNHDHRAFWDCPKAIDLASLILGVRIDSKTKRSILERRITMFEEEHSSHDRLLDSLYLLTNHEMRLESLVRGILISKNQMNLGSRRRKKFSSIVRELVLGHISIYGSQLSFTGNYRLPSGVDRLYRLARYDAMITWEGRPIVAVYETFQTVAGGRNIGEFDALIAAQRVLANEGIVLFVIAEGPGFRSMTSSVERVASELRFLSNLHGIEKGELKLAIEEGIARQSGERSLSNRANQEDLITASNIALRNGRPVTGELLNLNLEELEAFFIRYQAANPEYALRIERNTLNSAVEGDIRRVNSLIEAYYAEQRGVSLEVIVELIGNHLGFIVEKITDSHNFFLAGMRLDDVQIRLPNPLPICIITERSTNVTSHDLENVDLVLGTGANASRLAVLIDLVDPDTTRSLARRLTSQQRSQLVVIGRTEVIEILLRHKIGARSYLYSLILRDVDLSIISPFVIKGPTPSSMFFGREMEIRQIIEQIQHQSFALIGGRRSGKTSILRRLNDQIPEKYPICYIDCQDHPDRLDFLGFLHSLTKPELRVSRHPSISQAGRILRAFLYSQFGERFGVLLMDEVDDLFAADAEAEKYAHVISRALRSVSQSGTASIVVTGERILYSLTRDTGSPHWNFCSPVRIGSLGEEPARRLLREPLRALGIEITNEALDLALKQTAKHPNLLQYIGTELVKLRAPQSRTGLLPKVNLADLEPITQAPQYRNEFVNTFWSQSRALEKIVSVSLKSIAPTSREDIARTLAELGVHVQTDAILASLSFLELYGIASETDDGYILNHPAFDQYFGFFASDLIIDQWKEELS